MGLSVLPLLLLTSRLASAAARQQPQALPPLDSCESPACKAGDSFSLLQHSGRRASSASEFPIGKLAGKVAGAGKDEDEESPAMQDVKAAFEAIDADGRGLAAAPGKGFPPGYSKGMMPYTEHFQGIQRRKNFIYVSGSGETAGKGQIFVFDMASRPEAGVMTETDHLDSNEADKLVHVVEFDPEFWHAGGFSIYGKYLAVGAEKGCAATDRMMDACQHGSRVHFFDLSNPRKPKQLSYTVDRPTATAGAVALTREADGRYLLMVGGVDSATLDFYRSTEKTLKSDPGFEQFATWSKQALLVSPGVSAAYTSYQTMNFVNQKDGKIFLVGTTRTAHGLGVDMADLFEVDNSQPDSVTLKKVADKHLKCLQGSCNMAAGAGAFVNSPTELFIYATDWEPIQERYVLINEFHSSA